MKLKTIFVVMAFSLVANISLAFDGPQINWFNATSPAERNGQQVLLELVAHFFPDSIGQQRDG